MRNDSVPCQMGSSQSKQSKKETYYEKVLTGLQNDIKARQESIQRLRTFNRSCQVHLVLFSSFFYAGYSVYLFLQYKFLTSGISKASLAFLVLFPIGVFYTKKLVTTVVLWVIARRQAVLKARQTQLKDRIEDLKVETRYYQTKDLIEKYDKTEVTDNPELKQRIKSTSSISVNSSNTIANSSNTSGNTTVQLRNQQSPSPQSQNQQLRSPQLQNPQVRPPQLQSQHPQQLRFIHHQLPPPAFKSPTWMDRFMDALIGDDSRNQKYALICTQCFNHNGLATPEAFESLKYRCPNCGFFNQLRVRSGVNGVKSPDESIKEIKEIKETVEEKEQEEKKDKSVDNESTDDSDTTK